MKYILIILLLFFLPVGCMFKCGCNTRDGSGNFRLTCNIPKEIRYVEPKASKKAPRVKQTSQQAEEPLK